MVIPKPVKAFVMDLRTEETYNFQFNPTPLEESNVTNFEVMESPGLATPYVQYTGGENNEHNFVIYLNDKGMHFGYTRMSLHFFERFHPKNNKQFQPPPPILLAYGRRCIIGVVTAMEISKELFTPASLMPTKAEIDITILELPLELPAGIAQMVPGGR